MALRWPTWRSDLTAGLGMFAMSAYILLLNPQILAGAFAPLGVSDLQAQLLSSTALTSIFGCTLMALAGRPYVSAPGMGLNAFFAYAMVADAGVNWRQALSLQLLASLIALVLAVAGMRRRLLSLLPLDLQAATTAGIGLLLAMVAARSCGLAPGGLALQEPATMATDPRLLLAAGTVASAVALTIRGWTSAVLAAMLLATVLVQVFGLAVFPGQQFLQLEQAPLQAPVWPRDILLAARLDFHLAAAEFPLLLSLVLLMLFDSAGSVLTLERIRSAAGDKITASRQELSRIFTADSTASVAASLLGSSGCTVYLESASGLKAGSQSPKAALVVAACFALSLFAWPLTRLVPPPATAAALLLLAAAMLGELGRIDWNDPLQAVPALLTLIAIPLSGSIADGMSLGIVSRAFFAISARRLGQLSYGTYALAAALTLRYALYPRLT